MEEFTLLFIHGTGVRSESYIRTLEQIRSKVAATNLTCRVQSCEWGDVYGIDFDGLSLPEPPKRDEAEAAQAYRWEYLQVDPLFDLRLWCTRVAQPAKKIVGSRNSAITLWEASISGYIDEYNEGKNKEGDLKKKVALLELLKANGIEEFFEPAWKKVATTGLPKQAFTAAGDDVSAISNVFAEAVVAQMMHDAAAAVDPCFISPRTGGKIVTILLFDWNQAAMGLKDLFVSIFGKATQTIVRPFRSGASRAIAPAIGDILHYQALGADIRRLLREKILSIPGDIFILAHSLGGIACFELMVEARRNGAMELSSVKGLITAGSQVPLLYEFGALQTLARNQQLPPDFPRWLNLYDENDLLSYRANRLFTVQPDRQVDSMLPPFQAHSAYWTLDETWQSVGDFIGESNG